MATNILAPSQYHLPESDRRTLLASSPRKIEYLNDIVPDSILRENSGYFPKLAGRTQLSIVEMDQIMSEEVHKQRTKFIRKYGNDGVSMTS